VIRVPASKLKTIVRGLLVFLHGGMKDGWSVNELKANCASLDVSAEVTTIIASCWQQKAGQMATALLSRTIKANELVDMDWSFGKSLLQVTLYFSDYYISSGVTASSDDCDHLGKTYLQLKFTIDYGSQGLKDVFMELSLEQFFQFLAQMENCKQYLDFMDSA
jgi:hypothetical protein